MVRQTSCPDPGRLRELLGNRIGAERQSELIEHLDSCPGCQHTLEGLAADPAVSVRLRHLDVTPPPDTSAFWAAIDQLEHLTPPAGAPTRHREQAPVVLDFLEAPDPEMPGTIGKLGHFGVAGVLGRGGMGVVLKAFDGCLQRPVAIKVLDPQLVDDELAHKRFCREARAAASITHENVVAVHQVDAEESRELPYLVMQLVSGESLQDRLDRVGPLELRDILRIGTQTAAGLAAAHAQGLIHRDIKPANILLEEGTDRVKLTDFGLARSTEDVKLTQTGTVAGTPLYMAPEQARGEPLDHRTDLFSLGSVLYAMCTGQPPFQGSTPFLVLQQVTTEQPRPIREVNPEVPEWLANVIARLQAKKPEERFQSAAEVAEILGHKLALLTPAVKVPPAPSRKPGPSGLLGRVVIAAAGLVLLATAALIATEATGLTRILPSLAALYPNREEPGIHPRAVLQGNAGPVWGVAFAPDGDTVAMALDDGTVKLWDPAANKVKATLNAHDGPAWAVAYSPDGKRLATASDDGTAKLWDAVTRKEHRTLSHATGARSVAFSPDGRKLATGTRNGTVTIWDAEDGQQLLTIKAHRGVVMSLAFAPDGDSLASASGDKTVKVWDVATGQEQVPVQGHDGGIYAVRVAPDGQTLATGGWDKTVRLWDAATGQGVAKLSGHEQDVWAVAFHPGGKLLASASEDRTVKLWDVSQGKEVATLRGHTGTVYSVAFSRDGKTLASGSRDGTVRLWEVPAK